MRLLMRSRESSIEAELERDSQLHQQAGDRQCHCKLGRRFAIQTQQQLDIAALTLDLLQKALMGTQAVQEKHE
jgi:hypothetical protein